MAKPFKKEDNRNAMDQLAKAINYCLKFDGEKICITAEPLENSNHRDISVEREGGILVSRHHHIPYNKYF